jgi:hypothetical protein
VNKDFINHQVHKRPVNLINREQRTQFRKPFLNLAFACREFAQPFAERFKLRVFFALSWC